MEIEEHGETEAPSSSRREILAKAAVAGGLVWSAPLILSSTAAATVSNCGGSPPPCQVYRNKYHDNDWRAYDADQYGYWLDGANRPHDGNLVSHSPGSGTTSTVSFDDRVKWTRYAIFYGDTFSTPPRLTKVPGFEVANPGHGGCDGGKSALLQVQWPADRQSKDYVLVIEFTLAPYCDKKWSCVRKKRNGDCAEYGWTYSWRF